MIFYGGRIWVSRNGGLPVPAHSFLLKSLLLLLRLSHHSPYRLSLHIFMKHTGNRLFAVGTLRSGLYFLAVDLLCPVLRFLLLTGADSLPCFIQLHRVNTLCLLRSPAYSFRAASSWSEYFCCLFFQPL